MSGAASGARRAAWRLRAPILLLLLVPLAGLVGFGAWGLTIKYQQALAMERLERLSALMVRVSALVHETQRERGLSTGYLASGKRRFQDKLTDRRAAVDQEVERLMAHLAQFPPGFLGEEFDHQLALAMRQLEQLPHLRQQVDQEVLSAQDVLHSYTRLNSSFLGLAERLARLAKDSDIAVLAVAYVHFLQAKERAGVERALMTGVFSRDAFQLGEVHQFSRLLAQQQTLLDSFVAFAAAEQVAMFRRALEDDSFHQVESMRAAAYQRWDATSLEVDPNRWFEASSRRIDSLKTVEDRLAEGLNVRTLGLRRDAREGFQLYLALTMGVVLLAMVSGRAVGRHVLRLQEAERVVSRHRDLLEAEVRERTATLSETNSRLQDEILVRRHVELALKEALAQAEEVTAEKGRFLATMSHEIRTPLNGILGLADLLMGHSMAEESHRFVESIHKSGQVLLGTINNILDYSKIEAGRLELEHEDFNLREEVDALGDLMGHLAQRKGVGLRTNVAAGVPWLVNGDAGRLHQVLVNLLGNAVKFTEQGQVGLELEVVRWDQEGGLVRFQVWDTGIGMSPEQLELLFRPFAQAVTGHRLGGTGLGLVIAHHLVTLMGGVLAVESTPGRGTRFSVEVPLAAARARAAPGPTEQPLATPEQLTGLREARLLLVEDDPLNRQVVMGLLQRHGVVPQIASNGVQALELLEAQPFDVVVMDCQMPEMDGYAATREWRLREQARASKRRTPIIALTAHAMQGDRDLCLAAGMDDYLTKPVRRQSLLEALLRWLPAQAKLGDRERTEGVGEAAIDGQALARLGEEFGVTELDALLAMFLELLPENLNQLRRAVQEANWEEAILAAHTLKGRCRQLGVRALAEVGQRLESLCRNGEQNRVEIEGLLGGMAAEEQRAIQALTERMVGGE